MNSRQHHATWWPQAQEQGLVQGIPPQDPDPSYWTIAVALVGALVATIPLAAMLVLTLPFGIDEYPALIALPCLAAAAWILRQSTHPFGASLGLVLWITGICLLIIHILAMAIDDGWEIPILIGIHSLLLALQLLGVILARARWVQSLMAFGAGMALYSLSLSSTYWLPELWILQAPLLLIVTAWTAWCATESRRLQYTVLGLSAATWAGVIDAMLLGVFTGLLSLQGVESYVGLLFDVSLQGDADVALWFKLRHILACIATAAATLWLARRWQAHWKTSPRVLHLLVLAGVLLTISTWFVSSLALLAIVAAGALASARWRIAALCAFMTLVALCMFYYSLAWPLSNKGLGLMLLGAAMLLGLLVLQKIHRTNTATSHAPMAEPRQRMPLMGIVLGALLVFGLVNWDVRSKEQVIAHGERILVPLAPVDPRSLMQGDYMALRFDFPPELRESLEAQYGTTLHVLAQRDEQGIATVQRITQPGESLAAGQLILPLKRLKGEWTLVTDAYFFPEGRGDFFAPARFGDFRVLPDGRALLIGLADATGHAMELPPAADLTAPPPDTETDVDAPAASSDPDPDFHNQDADDR